MVLGSVIAIAVLGIVGWVVAVADSAPNIDQLSPRDPGQVSEVFAADGTRLGYIHSDILRAVVAGNRLPLTLKRATVAIEDRRFWSHGGIDPEGIARAAVKDALGGGEALQGGSTLTMQLVRNIYLPYQLADTRSLKVKIIEAKLADELERQALEAVDPRRLPQRRRLRHRRRADRNRRRRRVADVLQQARVAAESGPGRAPRRVATGAIGNTTHSRHRGSPVPVATRYWRRWCNRTTSPPRRPPPRTHRRYRSCRIRPTGRSSSRTCSTTSSRR